MDTSTFLTIAELSLALIGFAAIVAAFQRNEEGSSRLHGFWVRFLVEIAFTAFGLSLLPVLIQSFGVSGSPPFLDWDFVDIWEEVVGEFPAHR